MFTRRQQEGFSLVEVLIAMAVGTIGVLAFAGLQLQSLDMTEEAAERTIAASLASELAERMYSNSQDMNAKAEYLINADWAPTTMPEAGHQCMSPAGCNVVLMAQFDVQSLAWLTANSLPNGQIDFGECGIGNGYQCITVAWEDSTPAACSLSTDGSGVADCLVMQIKIW